MTFADKFYGKKHPKYTNDGMGTNFVKNWEDMPYDQKETTSRYYGYQSVEDMQRAIDTGTDDSVKEKRLKKKLEKENRDMNREIERDGAAEEDV